MIVDTSVWVDHLRKGLAPLRGLLETGVVLTHPFIVGELACGNLKDRAQFLDLFSGLAVVQMASHDEVMLLVEQEQLYGRGIGWVDAHLLASARLAGVPIWTHDKSLAGAAASLGLNG